MGIKRSQVREWVTMGRDWVGRRLGWVRAHPWKSVVIAAGSMGLLFVVFVVMIYMGAFGKLPTERQLRLVKNPLASSIHSSTGEVIGHYYIQNRTNIDSTEIPDHLKQALLATEDIRFYEHSGIDWRSLGRVFVKTLVLQDRSAGGGSTLTQQLAKNVFGRERRFFLSTPINKIREMFIARRLERIYTKDEILLLYLNTVSFGENLYGLEKASVRFFNTKPRDLDVLQSATLVGVLKAPTYYNPRNYPERAQTRRDLVLSQMAKYGYLEDEVRGELENQPVELKYTVPRVKPSFAAYFKRHLENEFNEWAADNKAPDGSVYDLYTDGLRIFTTIHTDIQISAEKAQTDHLTLMQAYFKDGWDARSWPGGRDSLLRHMVFSHPVGKGMLERGASKDAVWAAFQDKDMRTVWTPEGLDERVVSRLDSIVLELTILHAATVVLNAQDGRILGYVGGKDYGYSQMDQIEIPRQVGSVFKPVAFLSALEQGGDPCAEYENVLASYPQYEGWMPRNADHNYGGTYTMFGALCHSINTVSVQIMLEAGVRSVVRLIKRLGITSEIPEVPSLVLGTADISLMEMTQVYGLFANGGHRITPYSIVRIEDEFGEVIYQAPPGVGVGPQVVEDTLIQTLQKMLQCVNVSGTGGRMQGYGIPYDLIGKTGTTQNNSDGWFFAASPEVVAGTWMGTHGQAGPFPIYQAGQRLQHGPAGCRPHFR
jgi:penicillin-binding protein 1A